MAIEQEFQQFCDYLERGAQVKLEELARRAVQFFDSLCTALADEKERKELEPKIATLLQQFLSVLKPWVEKSGASEDDLLHYLDSPRASALIKETKAQLLALAKESSGLILKAAKQHPHPPSHQPPHSEWMKS